VVRTTKTPLHAAHTSRMRTCNCETCVSAIRPASDWLVRGGP
jgi:hypothetical protein